MAQTIAFDDLIPAERRSGNVRFDDLPSRAPVRGTEPKPSWFTSLMQGIGQGVSLGWGDEIMAGVKSMTGMAPSYAAELENQRGGLDRAREANPGWYFGGEVAGLLPSAFFPIGAAARGASMGAKMLRGTIAGAAQGAAYGAGVGEGSGKVGSALMGGGVGAGIGGLVPPGAAAVGAGVRRLRTRTPGRMTAERQVARAFDADAVDPAALNNLGPEGMLLDAGPNLRQQAGAVAAMPGEGQRILRAAMAQRSAGAGGRVRTMMDRALGPEPNVPQTVDDIAARRKAQADPLYDEAWKTPTPISPKLQVDLRERLPRRALLEAQKLARAEGVPFSPETMDTRSLDYIVRGLDQVISSTQPGSQLHRAYTTLRREMTDELTAANLPLKQAREVWSSSMNVEEALAAGQEVFRRTVSPNELMAAMAKMTAAEREAFRKGARDAISEIMGTARNDAGAAFRELGEKGWNKEKLAILIGRDEAERLMSRLEAERVFARSSDEVTRNSESARRLAGIDDIRGRSGPGPVRQAYAAGGTMGFIRGVFIQGVDKALTTLPDAELDAIARDIARMLTATGKERQLAVETLARFRDNREMGAAAGAKAAVLTRRVLGFLNAGAQPTLEEMQR